MAQRYAFGPILMALFLMAGCPGGRASDAVATPSPGISKEEASGSDAGLGKEPALGQNPSELRAKARPKSLEDVAGLSGYDEVSGKMQPPLTAESLQTGKALYTPTCRRCHGEDGRPKDLKGTLGRYNMANLGDAMAYKYGADGLGIYRSIAYGTAAPPHGMYKTTYTDAQIWSLVGYVQSLQSKR